MKVKIRESKDATVEVYLEQDGDDINVCIRTQKGEPVKFRAWAESPDTAVENTELI